MRIKVLTLFPKMFDAPLSESILGRAQKNKLVEIKTYDMRQWAGNSYGSVDDRPFGGGPGMVIRPEVIDKALKEILRQAQDDKVTRRKIIALSAKGKRFDQATAERFSKEKELVLICGHYEGFDQRILDNMVDEVISIGDYVLTGGELPALIVIDATVRLVAGVLGKDESSREESFSLINGKRVAEYPQYTRPADFKGVKVPEVLLSGDHKKIEEWRKKQLKQGAGK